MPHVGVHGLRARERQKGGAEHGEGDAGSHMGEIKHGMMRADRREDGWTLNNAPEAEHGNRQEPDEHDRPKNVAHELRSLSLHQEQGDQDRDGNGNDHRCQGRRVDLQTLDRAEHRDRRRDHAIAIEQGGTDQADDEQRGARASARGMPCIQQREQRDDTALAAIISAQNENGVFESDDEKQRPEDQRHGAYDVFGRGSTARVDRLFQPVERTGADVAVDNSKGCQHCSCRQLVGILPRLPPSLKDLGHAHVPSNSCPEYARKSRVEKVSGAVRQWHGWQAYRAMRYLASGADLTLATYPAASPPCERQIQSSTSTNNLLVSSEARETKMPQE